MTISNLGGIGGSHFTPIINVPEVAILGISRFKNRSLLMVNQQEQDVLPISLSMVIASLMVPRSARFLMHLSTRLPRVNSSNWRIKP